MVVFSRTGMGRPAGWTGTGPPLASFRFFRSTSRFYWRGGASVATAILTDRRRRSAPTMAISRRWWRWCVSTVTLRTGFRLGLQHWNWTRGMGQRNGGIGIRIAIDRIGNWRRELSLKCFRSCRSLLCRSFGRRGGGGCGGGGGGGGGGGVTGITGRGVVLRTFVRGCGGGGAVTLVRGCGGAMTFVRRCGGAVRGPPPSPPSSPPPWRHFDGTPNWTRTPVNNKIYK